MRRYYAYIRVSTTRQGERGSSLQEQRSAIESYARRFNLPIEAWFEEQETAAVRGRRLFNQMLSNMRAGKADGVIIHKIDRSARNLRDWADLGELIDRGIEVHFANESLDLTSRGGRLSADIQAVVAADYIRNLRDEVLKGFYGRLKQGLYPLPAPLGYCDQGGGKPKTVDAVTGPFIRLAFDLYGSGQYNLDTLSDELYRRGLRTRAGGQVSRTRWSDILNNQFYIGIIQIKRTGEAFQGVHEPIVSASQFQRVQNVLTGRAKIRGLSRDYLYRKSIRCDSCKRVLVPEIQKGNVYYRCHNRACRGICVREELIDSEVKSALQTLVLSEEELNDLTDECKLHYESIAASTVLARNSLELKLASLESRLDRLTDAYIDRLIEKEVFDTRKANLLRERGSLRETLADAIAGRDGISTKVRQMFELLKSLQDMDFWGDPQKRRDLIKSLSSNLVLSGKSLVVTWFSPFQVIAFRPFFGDGGPSRDTCRTAMKIRRRTAHPYRAKKKAREVRAARKIMEAVIEELKAGSASPAPSSQNAQTD